jgi:hypothetical protein
VPQAGNQAFITWAFGDTQDPCCPLPRRFQGLEPDSAACSLKVTCVFSLPPAWPHPLCSKSLVFYIRFPASADRCSSCPECPSFCVIFPGLLKVQLQAHSGLPPPQLSPYSLSHKDCVPPLLWFSSTFCVCGFQSVYLVMSFRRTRTCFVRCITAGVLLKCAHSWHLVNVGIDEWVSPQGRLKAPARMSFLNTCCRAPPFSVLV